MKIIYVSDLHGCKWKYEELINIAQKYGAKVVINGGDMLPKSGNLFSQADFITDYLDTHFAKFNESGIYYLCFLGNDDLKIFDDLFERVCNKYPFVISLAQHKYNLDGYEFIGFNWAVDYPFRLKDRCRMDTKEYIFHRQFGSGLLSTQNGLEEISDWISYANTLPTIQDELSQLIRPEDMEQSIYVMHMPPSGLGLDECYSSHKVGSKAIYNFLESNQPKLSLHGHIHESPQVSGKWFSKLNQTLCIQPGQLKPFTYVSIDLQTMKFERNTNT